MPTYDAENDNRFTSYVGHQPWMFVPDVGAPGGTAVLTTPKGRTIEATETQTTQPEVTEAKIGETRAPRLGPRVGFLVPEPFGYPGEYTFSISQDGYDDVVYVLDVKPSEDTEEVADGEVH
jgi:hypothetical protein